jgi:hypothetical protein
MKTVLLKKRTESEDFSRTQARERTHEFSSGQQGLGDGMAVEIWSRG